MRAAMIVRNNKHAIIKINNSIEGCNFASFVIGSETTVPLIKDFKMPMEEITQCDESNLIKSFEVFNAGILYSLESIYKNFIVLNNNPKYTYR
mgnify:CR=1 FL=1